MEHITLSAVISIIVGLGNPGPQYDRTRHNAGFWFIDAVAQAHDGQWQADAKFHGDIARVRLNGQDIRLLKPTTFMNRSGQAVAALTRFYKIPPEQILVVHDELDLTAGVARLKNGGGHGGHNGLRDIIAQTGSNAFMRLRIGIGRPEPGKSETISYVLGRASAEQQQAIDTAIDDATAVLPQVVNGEFERAMNALHSRK